MWHRGRDFLINVVEELKEGKQEETKEENGRREGRKETKIVDHRGLVMIYYHI